MFGALLLIVAAVARPSADVDYVGPPNRPLEALSAAIAARLGYDPFQPGSALLATVRFDESPSGCTATIDLRNDEGPAGAWRRAALPGFCGDLFDELALALALAIDPLLGQTQEAPTHTASVSAPPPPRAKPPVVEKREEPAVEGHLRFIAGASAMFDATPSPTIGFRFGAEYAWPRFTLGLDGRAYWPSTLELAERNEAKVFVARGELSPCLREEEFALCLIASLGVLRASGDDLSPSRVSSTPFAGTGLKAGMDFSLGRYLVLRAEIQLAVALTRTTVVAGDQEVWTQPPLYGGADVAVLFGSL